MHKDEKPGALDLELQNTPAQTDEDIKEVDVEVVPVTAEYEYPEGGWHAWMTVLGGALVLFCTAGLSESFGIYQDYYTRISLSEKSASDISWIGSTQFFLFYSMGLPTGRLFDEGYFKYLLAAGSLLYVFSMFMVSITQPHHYYQTFLSQGLGMGIGMGLMFIPTMSVVSHYFHRRRGLALGIVISGSSVGGVVWPIMLNHLINNGPGFAWAVRAAAFITLVLLFIANIVMKTRLPSRKERIGYVPPAFRPIIRDMPYITSISGGWLVFWGLFFPIFYLQLFSVLHGLSTTFSFNIITIMNASSTVGRTLPNLLGDRWGPLNVIFFPAIISAGLITVMLATPTPGGVIAFAILYGSSSGAFFSMINPAISMFATNPNEIGIRIGFAYSFFGIASLTGNPISGALLSPPSYIWSRAIIFNVVVILLGCGILAISRISLARRKGSHVA